MTLGESDLIPNLEFTESFFEKQNNVLPSHDRINIFLFQVPHVLCR